MLCVAGSVAAYRAIDVARLLMRHGADVTCVLSAAASRLIRAEYFRWATGNDVVTRLTGALEHVRLADYGRSDLVVVYPATANTLGKLAAGIDDTPVSTVLTVALGSRVPIIVCLAMHRSMYANAAVRRNIDYLRGKVSLVEPALLEGKAKAPEPEAVLARALARLGRASPLRGRRVLVVAGPTSERIDAVRAVASLSTGGTGALLADELAACGARVTLVYGPGCARPPDAARLVRVTSAAEMARAVRAELRRGAEIAVMAAAVSDYAPASPTRSKTKSGRRSVVVRLRPTPKIIDGMRRARPGVFLVGFKAEARVSHAELVRRARKKMAACGADMMVANDVGSPGAARDTVIVDADGAGAPARMTRARAARLIRREIEKRFAARERASRRKV